MPLSGEFRFQDAPSAAVLTIPLKSASSANVDVVGAWMQAQRKLATREERCRACLRPRELAEILYVGPSYACCLQRQTNAALELGRRPAARALEAAAREVDAGDVHRTSSVVLGAFADVFVISFTSSSKKEGDCCPAACKPTAFLPASLCVGDVVPCTPLPTRSHLGLRARQLPAVPAGA